MKKVIGIIFTGILIFIIHSCSSDDGPITMMPMEPAPSFDRKALLTNWADNVIIPRFEAYDKRLDELNSQHNSFLSDTNVSSLKALRNSWLNAYLAWQHVSIFDIGKAEEISLRNFTNIFPVDTAAIFQNISSGNYNLLLPSNFDTQGFGALDYLLFGIGKDDQDIVNILSSVDHKAYLGDIIVRLKEMNQEVLNDWKFNFRNQFIDNSGSSATASTDKIVNDFLFYYEKFFRAGKVGIPAGVFSGSKLSLKVEAPYSGIYSKQLFLEAFGSIENFYNGIGFETGENGIGLDDYLIFVQEQNNFSNINEMILTQWTSAKGKSQDLSNNFRDQIENDNLKMLETYDELQKAVVLLKVDMLQVLNIQVDFVDADGD